LQEESDLKQKFKIEMEESPEEILMGKIHILLEIEDNSN
jgi:hypothetical protein